ncbi:MAG TPA: methyltransferase [Thermoleophilaceae bacterium]
MDLWELADLRTPWSLRVVVTLRIADHIAAGREQLDDLAEAADAEPDALSNVLRQLVGKGVFAEPAPGRFVLNEAAERLRDPAVRIGLDLDGIGGRMAYAWGTLPTYARTGRSGYHELFGMPFWDDIAAHPHLAAGFDALMGSVGHGQPVPHFGLADGWDRVRTVVDVGGGRGDMLAELLRARPALQGTLVDLPGTVERSAEIFAAAGVADRVTTAPQSFFEPLPTGADLYLLRKVINDWPDREAQAILGRCAEAAAPDGRVVVLGGVSEDGAPGGLVEEMVLVAGQQRGVTEFADLARTAGLELVAAEREPSGYFVVECRPAA